MSYHDTVNFNYAKSVLKDRFNTIKSSLEEMGLSGADLTDALAQVADSNLHTTGANYA